MLNIFGTNMYVVHYVQSDRYGHKYPVSCLTSLSEDYIISALSRCVVINMSARTYICWDAESNFYWYKQIISRVDGARAKIVVCVALLGAFRVQRYIIEVLCYMPLRV